MAEQNFFEPRAERERETELIHLSRRVADKDQRKQESTTEHQKSLCLNLYKTARKENVTVHGLVLARVRLAPEGVNRNVSYNGGALGLPAGVSAHMGRTVFLNHTPKKREEPNPHTGQRNLCRSCAPAVRIAGYAWIYSGRQVFPASLGGLLPL